MFEIWASGSLVQIKLLMWPLQLQQRKCWPGLEDCHSLQNPSFSDDIYCTSHDPANTVTVAAATRCHYQQPSLLRAQCPPSHSLSLSFVLHLDNIWIVRLEFKWHLLSLIVLLQSLLQGQALHILQWNCWNNSFCTRFPRPRAQSQYFQQPT